MNIAKSERKEGIGHVFISGRLRRPLLRPAAAALITANNGMKP
jgi:hypothetical protein